MTTNTTDNKIKNAQNFAAMMLAAAKGELVNLRQDYSHIAGDAALCQTPEALMGLAGRLAGLEKQIAIAQAKADMAKEILGLLD